VTSTPTAKTFSRIGIGGEGIGEIFMV